MKVYLSGFSNSPLRVRLALALKGIKAEEIYIDLERDGGEQHSAAFAALNPQQMVPLLVDDDRVIRQSLAIIEYLEETHPLPPLLPKNPAERAHVRSLALILACDGQPLLNLRVRQYLALEMALPPAQTATWFRHWMQRSLAEYEGMLVCTKAAGRFSHGDSPTLADVCLVPQVLMARRFNVPTSDFPALMQVFDACIELPEFRAVISTLPETAVSRS